METVMGDELTLTLGHEEGGIKELCMIIISVNFWTLCEDQFSYLQSVATCRAVASLCLIGLYLQGEEGK